MTSNYWILFSLISVWQTAHRFSKQPTDMANFSSHIWHNFVCEIEWRIFLLNSVLGDFSLDKRSLVKSTPVVLSTYSSHLCGLEFAITSIKSFSLCYVTRTSLARKTDGLTFSMSWEREKRERERERERERKVKNSFKGKTTRKTHCCWQTLWKKNGNLLFLALNKRFSWTRMLFQLKVQFLYATSLKGFLGASVL